MSTRKKNTKSPHNPRPFSAFLSGASLSLRWSLLLMLLWINSTAFLEVSQSPWRKQRLSILSDPTASQSHIQLAQMYWQAGEQKEARKELSLAQDILGVQTNENILGIHTSPVTLVSEWQKQPEQLRKQYTYWQTVIAERPDYRDAYIQLAHLAYLLRFDEEADQYVKRLMNIDPTYTENLLSDIVKE